MSILHMILFLYLSSLTAFALRRFFDRPIFYRIGMGLLFVTWLGHSLVLGWRWNNPWHAPVSNIYESALFLAWAVIGVRLLLKFSPYRRRRPEA